MYIEKKFFLNRDGEKLLSILNIDEASYFDVTEEECKLDNLKSIIYLREANYNWDHICFISAIKSKNMEMLQYLRDNRCSSDIDYYRYDNIHDSLILVAVKVNNLETIKFLREVDPSKSRPGYKYP